MDTYQTIRQFKEEIENDLLEKISANIGQNFSDTRNSFNAMQERIIGENSIFLQKLEGMMTDSKHSVEKRLDTFDMRITKVERLKWLFIPAFVTMICIFIFNIVLLTHEISLAKRDTEIENTLKEIKQMIVK